MENLIGADALTALRAWRRLYPAFAEEITAALDHRAWMAAEETLERAPVGSAQRWRAIRALRG